MIPQWQRLIQNEQGHDDDVPHPDLISKCPHNSLGNASIPARGKTGHSLGLMRTSCISQDSGMMEKNTPTSRQDSPLVKSVADEYVDIVISGNETTDNDNNNEDNEDSDEDEHCNEYEHCDN